MNGRPTAGVDEAVRQIRTGNISGDWVVWTFPCLKSSIQTVLWLQSDIEPGYEERSRRLSQYALTDRRDAEAFIYHPVLRANFERICTVLYECDIIHMLREKLLPDNRDLMSMMYFEPCP